MEDSTVEFIEDEGLYHFTPECSEKYCILDARSDFAEVYFSKEPPGDIETEYMSFLVGKDICSECCVLSPSDDEGV